MKKLLAFILLCSTSTWAATRYVDGKSGAAPCTGNYSISNRDCSAGGSGLNSYVTIALGLAATTSGDTLDIRGAISGFTGVYNEAIVNTIPAGISVAARTRIIGHAGETVEIKPTSSASYVIYVYDKPYVEVSHLTLTGSSVITNAVTHFTGPYGTPGSHHYLFENNIVTNPGGESLPAANSHHGIVATEGQNDGTIRGNTFTSLISPNYVPGTLAVYTSGSNVLIENNTTTCTTETAPNGHSAYRTGTSSGTAPVPDSSGSIIRNNRATGPCYLYAIVIGPGNNRQVYNNIFAGPAGPTGGYGLRQYAGSGNSYYNNSVYNTTYGFYTTSGNNASVKNNIFSSMIGSPVEVVGGSGQVFSNNLCSAADTGCLPGLEAASATFTSTGSLDFTLKAGSKAIGTGADLSSIFTTDYAGTTRTPPWDIGGYKSAIVPSISVNTPAAGSSLQIGQASTITWTGLNLSGANVDITADLDNNGSFETAIPSGTGTPNDGSHPWTVSGTAGNSAVIKVKDSGAATFGISGTFNLLASVTPTITITAPSTGAVFAKSSSVVIDWTSTDLTGNVLIEITRDGGTIWTTVGTYAFDSADVIYTSDIPSSSNCKVRITSVNNGSITATSGTFRMGGRIM